MLLVCWCWDDHHETSCDDCTGCRIFGRLSSMPGDKNDPEPVNLETRSGSTSMSAEGPLLVRDLRFSPPVRVSVDRPRNHGSANVVDLRGTTPRTRCAYIGPVVSLPLPGSNVMRQDANQMGLPAGLKPRQPSEQQSWQHRWKTPIENNRDKYRHGTMPVARRIERKARKDTEMKDPNNDCWLKRELVCWVQYRSEMARQLDVHRTVMRWDMATSIPQAAWDKLAVLPVARTGRSVRVGRIEETRDEEDRRPRCSWPGQPASSERRG